MNYKDFQVVFRELPNEVTLAINISGCPIKCPDCHSKYLWEDIGTELNVETLDTLISNNNGITAVCIMGGDKDPLEVRMVAEYIKKEYNLKVGWYSGAESIHKEIINHLNYFDFIKIGSYNSEKGALDNPTTNQKIFAIVNKNNQLILKNITKQFWNEA